MVNEVVLEYLRNNVSNYSLNSLKEKVMAGGYSEEDFNSALEFLRGDKTIEFFEGGDLNGFPMSYSNVAETSEEIGREEYAQDEEAHGRFKWARFSSFIGFGLLAFGLIFFTIGFFLKGSESLFIKYLSLIFFFICFISYFFYIYGFFKLGCLLKSNLLKLSSVLKLGVLAILFIMFLLVYFSSGIEIEGSFFQDTFQSQAFSGMGGNIVSSQVSLFSNVPTLTKIFLILIVASVFVFLIIRVSFSISLISFAEKIKHSLFAGVLGIILATLIFSFLGYSIYLVFNPIKMASLFEGSMRTFFTGVYYVSLILGFVTLFLESIALRDASKNFEI